MSKDALTRAGVVAVESFADSLRPVPRSSTSMLSHIKAPRLRHSAAAILKLAREEGFEEGQSGGFAAGHAEGFSQGLLEGRAHAEAEARLELAGLLESVGERMEGALAQIDEAMAEWYTRAEREMEELALEVAEKILRHELRTSRESLLEIVRAAIGEVTHAASARVRLNPFDCEAALKYKDEILACAGSVRRLEIVEDPSILGGCIIDTDGGLIDASFHGQLEAMADALEDAA